MGEKESILIVDDNGSTCRSLSLILDKKGYETQRQGVPISHYAPGSEVGRAYAEITKSISIDGNQKKQSIRRSRNENRRKVT